MISIARMMVDDFIALSWRTYGVAELERRVKKARYAMTDEALSDINLLTEILYAHEMYERGKEHLESWLEANGDSELAPRYRLRLVLYLNKLKEPQAALSQLDMILSSGVESPTLICLKANFMSKCGRPRNDVIAKFEEAVAKMPNWSEPKIELVEQLVLNGDYLRAQRHAEDYLRSGRLAPRENAIVSALRIVAQFCQDPKLWEAIDFRNEMSKLNLVEVPEVQREEWNFNDVGDMLITMGMADAWLKKAALELRDWLKALEAKLRPAR